MQKRLPKKFIKPVANPVDTYVRPAHRAVPKPDSSGQGLIHLAQALSKMQPSLDRFFTQRIEEQDQETIRKAQHDHAKLKMSFADAVKLHERTNGAQGIPPGASPFYIQNYKQMNGEWLGRSRYQEFVGRKWQESGLATQLYDNEAEASANYFQWLNKTRNEFADTYGGDGEGGVDAHWFDGFLKSSEQVETALSNTHLKTRWENNEKRALDMIEEHAANILTTPDQDIPASIQKLYEEHGNAWGVSGGKFNGKVLDAYRVVVKDLASTGHFAGAGALLASLDEVVAGTGTLGSTGAGRAAKAELKKYISDTERTKSAEERSAQSFKWQEEDRPLRKQLLQFQVDNLPYLRQQREEAAVNRDDRAFKEATFAENLSEILKNPGANHEPMLERLAADKRTASLVGTLRTAWDQRLNAQNRVTMTPEMQTAAAELRIDIVTGDANYGDLMKAIRDRQIDMPLMGQMLQDIVQRDRYNAKLDRSSQRSREFISQGQSWLRSALTKKDAMGIETNGVLVLQALMEYQAEIDDFLDTEPEASSRAVRKARDEIIEKLVNDPMYKADMESVMADMKGRPDLQTPDEVRAARQEQKPGWAQQ